MIRTFFTLLFSLNIFFIYCQQPSYSFGALNFNNTARSAALGGYSLAIFDNDPSIGIISPSNIIQENSGKIVLNYVNYFADTDYALLNYTHSFKKIGTFSTSFIYCDYGGFDYSDPDGTFGGSQFFVYDIMGQVGYSKKLIDNLQIGVNLKFVSSFYEQYSSSAIGVDISSTYYDSEKGFGSSFLIQNIGRSMYSFQKDNIKENLPFNIQLSLNKKLSHSPIRFHFIYHDLQIWNINSNRFSLISNRFNNFSNNFLNHVVISSEFLFSENFHFRVGYNFKNRIDLQPISRAGGIGFSWGVGFKIKKIHINYSYSRFHFSGNSNNLTLIKSIKK